MAGMRGNAGSSSRPSSAAATPPKSAAPVQRERFTVELKLNETTFVSWKKLLSESCKVGSFQAEKLATKHNGCLVNKGKVEVIEHNHTPKRRRRKDSTSIQTQKDSEQTPSELVNMGSMRIETDASSVPSAGKKSPCKIKTNYAEHCQGDKHIKSKLNASTETFKKMSADFAKHPEKDSEQTPSELVNMGSMRTETDASSVPSAGKKSPCKIKTTNYAEHYQGDKHLKSKLNASTETFKKMSADFATHPEKVSSVKISSKNPLTVQPESKKLDMHKTGAISSGDIVHKSRGKTESFDVMPLASWDKGISSQVKSQPKKLSHSKDDMEASARMRHKESDGVRKLPGLKSFGNIYPKKRAACHEEQITRKRPASSTRVEETTKGVHTRYGQERTTSVSAGEVPVSPDRPRASSGKSADKTLIGDSGFRPSLKHYDKVSESKPVKDGGGAANVKRKSGLDIQKCCDLKQHSPKQQMKGRPRADKSNLSPRDLHRLKQPNLPGSTLRIS